MLKTIFQAFIYHVTCRQVSLILASKSNGKVLLFQDFDHFKKIKDC